MSTHAKAAPSDSQRHSLSHNRNAQDRSAQERAEANFKRKELQDREASKAWAEYQAGREAERDKTARLRVLRLAKEAADAAAAEKAQVDGVGRAEPVGGVPVARGAATKKAAAGKAKKPAKRRVLVEAEEDVE